MEMQNITLSLPKSTIRKVKILAARQNSSISRLVAQALEEIVEKDSAYEEAKERQLKLMEKGFDMGFGLAGLPSRDEIHERR